MAKHVKHRLLELIHKKELEENRRVPVTEIAKGSGVSERLVYRWLDTDEPVKRFDDNVITGFCDYFDVDISELLVYKPEKKGKKK